MSHCRIAMCGLILLFSSLASAMGQPPAVAGADSDPLPNDALLRMGSTRLLHSTWLTSVVFSQDDRWLGTADSNGVVRLWDAKSGQQVWGKPRGTGRTLAFSPDGRILAIGGFYSPQITLWDLKENRAVHELPQNARSLKFTSDGSMLAAAGRDNVVRLWNPETGQLIREFHGHRAELYAVTISPDDRTLASGGGSGGNSANNEIRIWDIATGKEVGQLTDDNERLKNLPDATYSLSFSADGRMIGSAGPYVVRLWDVAEGRLARRLDECSYDIAFAPSSNRAVAVGDYGIYDPSTGVQTRKLDGDVGVYGRVAWSHDGKLIASGNKQGQVQLWNADTGKQIVLRSGHEAGIRSVGFSPDGTLAVSLSRDDSTLRVWGVTTGKQLLKIPMAWRGSDAWWNEEGSNAMFAPYGREIVSWTFDSTVRFWQLDGTQHRSVRVGDGSATAMAFSKDGNRVAVMHYDGGSRVKLGIYELDGGTRIATLDPFKGQTSSDPWVSSMAFSPDGNTLAVGCLDSSLRERTARSVQLWDIETATIVQRLRSANAPPGKLCFSPDGRLLVTSPTSGTPLHVWDVSSGAEVHSFKVEADAHGRDPVAIAFSPDSRTLAAADANHEIYVWEVATWEKTKTFRGHQKAVNTIAFSPDGKNLLSGSDDTTMLLWTIHAVDAPDVRLTAKQLEGYWKALAHADAEIAASASAALKNAPQQTVMLFRQRLTAGEIHDEGDLPKLIADLNSEDVETHLQATVSLKAFGGKASADLFHALANAPDATVRRRIEGILETIGNFPIAADDLRRNRAIQLLEVIGSPAAESILVNIADTMPTTQVSAKAAEALKRLNRRARAPKTEVIPGR